MEQTGRSLWNCSGFCRTVPSLDKGRHGFDGQKRVHTASSPLTIRQVFSAGLSLSGRISAPAKLPAPDRNGFSSDFCFLRRRWAGAHQGEKSKKRRKDALSGVFAFVERWYVFFIISGEPAHCKGQWMTGRIQRRRGNQEKIQRERCKIRIGSCNLHGRRYNIAVYFFFDFTCP